MRLWDRAIDTGLMAGGTDVKYHFTPDGKVLSVAVGRSGQVLANGERLTPSVAEQLRQEMPLLAGMVTFYENNQLAGRGLDGAPQDGVMPLLPPTGPDPIPTVDEEALAEAQAATAVLVHQGKVAEPTGAMVIPAQRGGVLFAVGGRNGELYVNGRALTRQWADALRSEVPGTRLGHRPAARGPGAGRATHATVVHAEKAGRVHQPSPPGAAYGGLAARAHAPHGGKRRHASQTRHGRKT